MVNEAGEAELRAGDTVGVSGAKLLPRKGISSPRPLRGERRGHAATGLLADKTMTIASGVTRRRRQPCSRSAQVAFARHVADAMARGDLPLVGGCFNGKIERPRLANCALTAWRRWP
jgi:hypothetical protein